MKRFYSAAILSAVLILAQIACQQTKTENAPPKTTEITVSAAASLQDALREIAVIYEQKNQIKVNYNFAASGVLQKQIEQAAPADVFASAGKTQMDALAAKNLIVAETRRDFAANELILIAPAKSKTEPAAIAQLLEKGAGKIALGIPASVPAGFYAEQTLRNLNLWDKVQPRLVFAEDVRQVLTYVERGEAEFGFVYASDVKKNENKVNPVAIAPRASHDAINYPIAVVTASAHQDAAKKFVDLILSAEGQAILQKNGFQTVK